MKALIFGFESLQGVKPNGIRSSSVKLCPTQPKKSLSVKHRDLKRALHIRPT